MQVCVNNAYKALQNLQTVKIKQNFVEKHDSVVNDKVTKKDSYKTCKILNFKVSWIQ